MTNTPPTINVLLVEDNPDDVDLIKESLGDSSEAHFEVHNEGRLMRAQHQFAIREFDIVLLDLGLPDSSGLRTLETVLEWEVGLPIVVLTGLAEDVIGAQAVELGAHAYLVKRLESFNALPGNLIEAVELHRAQHAESSGGLMGLIRRLFGGS
jgi:DNA-binding response OmpR family regulator